MSVDGHLGPAAAWDALERMTLGDEAERLAALRDDDLDGELALGGFDPKALRTRGLTIAASLGAKPPAGARGDSPIYVQRLLSLAGVALVVFAAAAAVPLVAIPFAQRGGALSAGTWTPGRRDAELAAALRGEALHACSDKRWLDCWHKLDAAKALDPIGEEGSDIREARAAIRTGLDPREP